MATPSWFDANTYFENKRIQAGFSDSLSLLNAFKAAGYATDADGLYKHFLDYGNAENVSPNAWFNSAEYLYDKAVSYFNKPDVTTQQVGSMKIAMAGAGMSPWDHFQKYWAEDYAKDKSFHNPSTTFDTSAYMNAKLAQMQVADPAYTMDMLVKALTDLKVDPINHYLQYGKAEGLNPVAVGAGTPGNTYNLGTGDDTKYGTTGNDFFYAKVDALSDADYIDGHTGNDTLYADVKGGVTIAPSIVNVETVLFRAQTSSVPSGDNLTKAYIDAEKIVLDKSAMLTIGSDNSRADLKIEDVRHNSDVTTVRMANTDPGSVNLELYFNPQNLVREGSVKSGTMNVELMDVKSGALNGKPLQENPFDTFSFEYTNAAGAKQIVKLNLGTINGNATYNDLLKAFQDALDASPVKGIVTAKLGNPFAGSTTVGGTAYDFADGMQIQLNSATGTIAAKDPSGANIPGTGWGVSTGVVPPTGGIVWDVTNNASTTCPLIKANVQLDNVGRVLWDDDSACLPDDAVFGSEAGKLVIGSMAGRGGVERFDVVVDKGSWLSSMSSTNDTLRMVTVKNDAVNGSNDKGNLFIGTPLAVGAANTDMDLTNWMNAPRLLSTDGLVNVKVFDASAMEGKVNIGAHLNDKSLAKYMADVDGLKTMYSDNAPSGDFAYTFGKNADTLNMLVNAGIAADRDFKLGIKMGEGNDLVNFQFENMTGSRVLNQIALNNVSIDLGAGNDTLWSWGNGAVKVTDGAGNDKVYVGQNAVDKNAVFVFGANNPAETFIKAGPDGAQPLQNEVVSTPANAFTFTASASATRAIDVKVTFNNITSVVKINVAAGKNSVSMEDVNQAIIKAINSDPTLGALLVAKDGMGNSLLVESLVDGVFANTDLKVTFVAATGSTFAGGASGGYAVDGALSAAGSANNSAIAKDGVTAIGSSLRVTAEGGSSAEVQEITLHEEFTSGIYSLVYNGTTYTIAAAADFDDLIGKLDTALGATATITNVAERIHITDGGTANISNDTVLVKGTPSNVIGTIQGTTSMNTVNMSAGNDVIALNVNSALNAFDKLVITDAFGNDTVMGFQTGIDKIDVSALVSTGGTQSGVSGLAIAGAGAGALTVAEVLAQLNTMSFAVNEKGVVFIRNANTDSNAGNYTVCKIVNDGTVGIVAGEVTILGTITTGDSASFLTSDLITA